MKELLQQYKLAQELADELASQMYSVFMSIGTVEEKFKLVLEYGDVFLREESYYCPHVRTSEGEVSLYDDLYVERYQTLTIEQLIESVFDDCDGVDWDSEDYLNQQITCAPALINLDTPESAILRDMLNKGIRAGRFDW